MLDQFEHFTRQVDDLAIDRCSISIRYLGYTSDRAAANLWCAVVEVGPLRIEPVEDFALEAGKLLAGRLTLNDQLRSDVLNIAQEAQFGRLAVGGLRFEFNGSHNHTPPATMETVPATGTTWAHRATLLAKGPLPLPRLAGIKLARLDGSLRAATHPFDGLQDLLMALGLPNVQAGGQPSLHIEIGPPVDLELAHCSLLEGLLSLQIVASEGFPVENVTLAALSFPTRGAADRHQLGSAIMWGQPEAGFRRGNVRVGFDFAPNVLVMLSANDTLVRRQYYADPHRSQNARLLSAREFDPNLGNLTGKLLNVGRASKDFEKAVAQLGFLLGLSTSLLTEDDAPDLIAFTPVGRIVVVECTVRVQEFHTKVSKLVDRRSRLTAALEKAKSGVPIIAVLVSAQPRDQIVDTDHARKNHVVVVAQEELKGGLELLRAPHFDPERIYDRAVQSLVQ